MHCEIDLKKLDIQKTSQLVADKVKKSLLDHNKGKSTAIIAIEDSDGVSVIPAGKVEDILTLIVIELVHVIRIYKITDIDGLLEFFVEQVKSYFEKNGE